MFTIVLMIFNPSVTGCACQWLVCVNPVLWLYRQYGRCHQSLLRLFGCDIQHAGTGYKECSRGMVRLVLSCRATPGISGEEANPTLRTAMAALGWG